MLKLALPALALCLASPALADAIDGHWCSAEGRHIQIKGPDITTPAGVKMTGDYTRHTFAFVAPAAEPEAGKLVNMRLMGETRVSVQVDGGAAPAVWKRCEDVS